MFWIRVFRWHYKVDDDTHIRLVLVSSLSFTYCLYKSHVVNVARIFTKSVGISLIDHRLKFINIVNLLFRGSMRQRLLREEIIQKTVEFQH